MTHETGLAQSLHRASATDLYGVLQIDNHFLCECKYYVMDSMVLEITIEEEVQFGQPTKTRNTQLPNKSFSRELVS